MSKKMVYYCDFCGALDKPYSSCGNGDRVMEHYVDHKWFIVNKTFHACKDCGHNLHYLFNKLGIKHSFVCNEYIIDKNKADELGEIIVL